MPQVSHVIVFLAVVWFAATTKAYHAFLAPCPTRHRLIFLPNFATSVASILLAKLSLLVNCRVKLTGASWEKYSRSIIPVLKTGGSLAPSSRPFWLARVPGTRHIFVPTPQCKSMCLIIHHRTQVGFLSI